MRKVGFEAAIVELKVKRLASEDKSLRLTLEVDNPEDSLVDDLNKLFVCGGQRAAVAVAELPKRKPVG